MKGYILVKCLEDAHDNPYSQYDFKHIYLDKKEALAVARKENRHEEKESYITVFSKEQLDSYGVEDEEEYQECLDTIKKYGWVEIYIITDYSKVPDDELMFDSEKEDTPLLYVTMVEECTIIE